MKWPNKSTRHSSPDSVGSLSLLALCLTLVFCGNSRLFAATQSEMPLSTITYLAPPSPDDLKDESTNISVRVGSNGIPRMIAAESMECESGQCRQGCSRKPIGTLFSDSELDPLLTQPSCREQRRREMTLRQRF